MSRKEPTATAIEEGVRSWREAVSYAAICELMAQFIQGRCAYSPIYPAPVDDETNEIATYLAALNRAGFLTIDSQPGASEQRAFVNGFAPESIARVIARVTLYTDLYVLIVPPWAEGGYQIPVGIEDLQPCIWSGFSEFTDLDAFDKICRPEVMQALVRAWSVSVVDLSWGRRGHLWEMLCSALDCYSEEPDAALGLDTDFVGPLGMDRRSADNRKALLRKYGLLEPSEE